MRAGFLVWGEVGVQFLGVRGGEGELFGHCESSRFPVVC